MSLQLKYILFIGGIHLLIGYLAYLLVVEEKIWFLAVEIALLISLLLSYRLYKQLVAPLRLLASGAAAIEDQDFQVKFLKTGSREMDQLIEVYNAMIAQLRRERQQTREQHYFMQQIFQTSPSAILLFDFDQCLSYVNSSAQRWFDLERYKGVSLADIPLAITQKIYDISHDSPTTYAAGGSRQYRILRTQFVDRGFNREFVIIEDLSREILDAEKRAYGKVIRMMAHEVNNSIGAINSIIESNIDYQQELSDPFAADMSAALQVAKERNDRLNAFMRNFADIIRLPPPQKEMVDLTILLRDTCRLMRPYANEFGVEIDLQLTQPVPDILLDARQIEQIFINIIKNAVEAIGNQGRILVTWYPETRQLTIKDNGRGISDEQAEQLFTPFYSDKPHGQGIGLTLTRDILLNHGFDFSLRTVDGWTCFTIRF